MSFVNPLPVAVLVVPVESGVLVIRRGIEPQLGELALPGGFIDLGETWERAAARELHEETGISIDPASIRHFRTVSPPDGKLLLVFGQAPPMRERELPPFEPSLETLERLVVDAPRELAFPTHTEVLAEFFARR
jgi:8-oxo-dGTP pyrophosphatase MutT (NUDIX family)